MDDRRSTGRLKRQLKSFLDESWDCSVCTYRNTAEAYKCEMCDVRKGTSTRKPRPNPQLVASQAVQQFNSLPTSRVREEKTNASRGKISKRPRLKNVDRSSAKQTEVTVGSVTVVITDYEPKKASKRRTSGDSTVSHATDSDNSSSIVNELNNQALGSDDDDVTS